MFPIPWSFNHYGRPKLGRVAIDVGQTYPSGIVYNPISCDSDDISYKANHSHQNSLERTIQTCIYQVQK